MGINTLQGEENQPAGLAPSPSQEASVEITPGASRVSSQGPIDPWCDDGSLSRAEPPWLRDKRRSQLEHIQKRKKLLQERRDKLYTNPFGPPKTTSPSSTNPFDTSSCSDSSGSQQPHHPIQQPPPILPTTNKTTVTVSSTNPFGQQTPPRSTMMGRHINPFDSSVDGSDEPGLPPKPRNSGTNPFDSSTEGSSPPRRPRIARPSQSKGTQKEATTSSKDSVQDSLDQFLNTTEETVHIDADTTLSDEQPVTPSHRQPSSVADDSFESAPSDTAREAAEALKRSFHQRSKSPRVRITSSTVIPDSPTSQYTPPTRNVSPGQSARPPSSRSPSQYRAMPPPNTSGRRRPPPPPPRRPPSKPVDLDASVSMSTETTPTPAVVTPPPVTTRQAPTEGNDPGINPLLALHDLCDEARTTDDIAWRNALCLLASEPHLASQLEPKSQMAPLHVCALAAPRQPPPIWMTRALLYTNPQQTEKVDCGGRLPLHLIAATSADADTMQLLVQEYPAAVAHKDSRGFTPLQLLLKNDQVSLTLEQLRILLGQTHQLSDEDDNDNTKKRPVFRKGQHLQQTFQDLHDLQRQQETRHERQFDDYPDDVQRFLRKITQWKRRQVHKGLAKETGSGRLAVTFDNPASIPTPTGKLLPLHLLVRRSQQTGQQDDSTKEGIAWSSSDDSSFAPIITADMETLVHVLIAAHPQALVTKDVQGRTPLLTALLQTDSVPTAPVMELLLGVRTPSSDPKQPSPAKIPATDTLQLPLHVAAEERADEYEFLSTIYEANPQAITTQDVRGRTPLHCALSNYRSVSLDASTFEMLANDQVAKTRDWDGQRPLDVLVSTRCKCLQQFSSGGQAADAVMMSGFLNASIDAPRNHRQAQDLLQQLRDLPPWLRRHACASRHVQKTLMEEVASPMNTAVVLLHGLALVGLLVVLRLALQSEQSTEWDTWVLVNYFAAYHLAILLVYSTTTWYLGDFYRLVFTNAWRWIDLGACCCAIGTAYVVQTDIAAWRDSAGFLAGILPEEDGVLIATLGSWATGLLWVSFLGYIMQWWCGMAVFVGSAMQLLSSLIWPVCVAAMGVVGMSQVLYTLEDCVDGNICGLSDAYTTVYWLILGEPVLALDETSVQTITTSMMVLLITFTILWLWWIVAVIVTAISESHRLDRHQLALRWFWEPKVALTILARESTKEQMVETPTCTERYCDSMGRLWHVLTSSLRGGHQKRDVHWYACCFRPNVIILTRLIALIALPIWFCLGIATLGILWPPQLRRWIFSTSSVDSTSSRRKQPLEEKLSAAKLSSLKGELLQFQTKSIDQNAQMQHDIAEIKDLLLRAMMTEDD